jgi:hypothetical protein
MIQAANGLMMFGANMPAFKVGDRVRLKETLQLPEGDKVLKVHARGQVVEVSGDGYTIQFDDSKTAVEGVAEAEIEADQ